MPFSYWGVPAAFRAVDRGLRGSRSALLTLPQRRPSGSVRGRKPHVGRQWSLTAFDKHWAALQTTTSKAFPTVILFSSRPKRNAPRQPDTCHYESPPASFSFLATHKHSIIAPYSPPPGPHPLVAPRTEDVADALARQRRSTRRVLGVLATYLWPSTGPCLPFVGRWGEESRAGFPAQQLVESPPPVLLAPLLDVYIGLYWCLGGGGHQGRGRGLVRKHTLPGQQPFLPPKAGSRERP